ncbi:MAG: tripartite tricarboxylate transporter substrate binding protein [Acidobacteria bacterium]|nr:tripartite tricarboxylate transporter substrate binding protein [Acidobacteriota bacterium]
MNRAVLQSRWCRFPLFILLLLAAAMGSGCKKEGPYPNHEIEIVIPFAPGEPADIAARIIQPKLSELLGVPVGLVNKPGGGGALGTFAVAKAPPDGYQVLATSSSVFTVLPATASNLSYSLADFTPLGSYLSDWSVIAVAVESPWKNLEQFVEYAKKNPGKLNYGSPGAGTVSHFAMEQLKQFYKLEIEHVPFSGAVQVKEALLTGQLEVAAAGLATLAPLFQSGELRPLVTTAEDWLPKYPDIPTMYEKGISDFPMRIGMGLFVSAGTAKEISERLSGALATIMQDPAVYAAADAAGLDVDYRNPDASGKVLGIEAVVIRAAAEEFQMKN